MSEIKPEQYRQRVEEQGRALLQVIQSVALGDLDVKVEVPEGVEVLSELAAGIESMVGALRERMAQQVQVDLVERQSQALLGVVQSVTMGDLDVEIEVPEGIEALSELGAGLEIMLDDLRKMLHEQERAREEIESSRLQVEAALAEMTAVQRRFLRQEWEDYVEAESKSEAERASLGYYVSGREEGPSEEPWLSAMTAAVQGVETVHWVSANQSSSAAEMPGREEAPGEGAAANGDWADQSSFADRSSLAIPIQLYGEVIGALGFSREGGEGWGEEEIAAAEAVVEQLGWALESQRLFDEEQQARSLLSVRVNALDCLNDIGRRIDEAPPVDEFLEWVTGRIPAAMRFPELCATAVQFNGQVFGSAEAVDLPCQIVQGLFIGGEQVGRITIAYTEERGFLDEESALLGDIGRRVSGYIENRRLLQETQEAAAELDEERTLLRTLIDSLPDYVYVKDRQSRFVVNNIAHLRVMGATTQEEVTGKSDFDFFPADDAAGYYAHEQALMDAGEALIGLEETVIDQESGELQWVSTTKVPLRNVRGEVYGFVGTSRDITARRRTEGVLRRRRAQLECLSDIGQRIGESPPVAEFLEWVAERIPEALQYPDSGRAAIEFAGQVYGAAEATGGANAHGNAANGSSIGSQIVQSLYAGGESIGRVYLAYTQDHEFLDEESALLGEIARRVSSYLENQRLLEEAQARAERERLVRTAADRMRRGVDAEAIMRVGLEELSSMLGTSKLVLRLGSREQLALASEALQKVVNGSSSNQDSAHGSAFADRDQGAEHV